MPDPNPSNEPQQPDPVTSGTPGSDPKPVTPEPTTPAPQPTPVAEPKPGDTPTEGEPKSDQVPVGALLEERGKRQALEAEIASMKLQVSQPQMAPPGVQPQPPNQIAQDLDKLWDTDPRKAVQTEMMYALDWFDKIGNAVSTQADDLATKYTDFSTWRSAAERYVRALPLQQRAQPGVLETAYYIVRGQNTPEILKQQQDDLMKKFQTGELAGQVSTPPGTVSAPAPTGATQATDEQRTAAAAMGISEADYLANVKVKTSGGV